MKRPLEMDVYMDHIVIEHQIVKRPAYIQRSIWMRIWENIKNGLAGIPSR
jgi:hypothetical protein